jgi:hypothetical protein
MHTRGPDRGAGDVARLDALERRALLAAISWDGGGGDALWSNPLNWSLDFVPRQVDDVTISVPGVQRTVIADAGPIRVGSLALAETLIVNSGVNLTSLGPFDLGQDADLRINGLVNWAAGTWQTGKPVRVNPGGSLNIGSTAFPTTGGVTLRSELDNAGRLAWRGGTMALGVDGSITNRTGKAMDFASPMEMTGSGALANHGLLRKGGQSDWTTTIDVGFENTDRFYILRGGVAIGEDDASAPAAIDGVLAVLDQNAEFTFNAEATHADGVEFRGRGIVSFVGGGQTFEGDALFAARDVRFEGPSGGGELQVRVTGESSMRGAFETDGVFFRVLAPLTLDGTFTLTDTLLSDTGIVARPPLTIDGSVVADLVALAVDTVVTGGSTLQAGLDTFGDGSLGISGGYSLTNAGTVRHLRGILGIGVGSTLENLAGGTLILAGPTVGGGPLSGPVVNLGTLIRENSPTNNGTTTITGALDNTGTVDVQSGTLEVTGDVEQLPAVPTAQNTTLNDGLWRVRNLATLDLPEPIELIGAQATLDLIGLSNVPDLVGSLRENRGLMLLSGNRPGISGPGPAIVNKGTIQMDGDAFSLQVFETPVDQRPAGRIIVKEGTLQLHGTSGATRNFANPGLIRVEDGKLSLDLDEGGVLGTFTNTGTLDIRQQGQVVVDGAMGTSGTLLVQIGNPFRGHIATTRDAAIGGTLRATYVGQNYTNFHSASIIIPASFTVTGSFSTFTPVNVPSGFSAILITQFGVQVRLEE